MNPDVDDDTGKEQVRRDVSLNSDGGEKSSHPAEFFPEDTKNDSRMVD